MAPYAQHADELSRAISEIDLNAIRIRADSESEKGPAYTTEQLFKRRPEQEAQKDGASLDVCEANGDGLKTPDFPAAPPPTPAQPSPRPTAQKPGGEPIIISPPQEIAEEGALQVGVEEQNNQESRDNEDAEVNDETAGLPEPDEPSRIRRQVEYYFSDDNLPEDVFLWKRTEGSHLPIKVESIARFGRMRKYEYSAVVAALKESKFLEITGSQGQEMVKRKTTYNPSNPISHADTYTDYEKYPYAYKPESITPNLLVPCGEKAGRKKTKSSGQSVAPKGKQPKPTGFEEFYADPPITPKEAIDEYEDFYHPSRPFHERIQSCVQRYRARRKLNEKRSNIFTQYLILGGLDSGAKQFTGGLDEKTLQESSADEIAAIRATDYIRAGNAKFYDPDDDENWIVDFEGVMKGFFSYRIPAKLGYDTEDDIKLCSTVLKNFLNYVLQHGVCPEYTDDIMAARRICDKGEKELCTILQLTHILPDSYNIAASTLYDGRYKGQYIGNTRPSWMEDCKEMTVNAQLGMSDPQAERIFKTAVAFLGKEKYMPLINGNAKLVKSEHRFFEIVKVDRADLKTISLFSGVKDHKGQAGNIKPLGLMRVRSWDGPGFVEEDGSGDESTTPQTTENTIETFWLDDEILQHCFEGMKLGVVARELDVGIKFFDVVTGVYCSFFTYLENEKMKDWKEPVPNERLPPTEDNADAEEKAMVDELNDFD